VAYRTIQSRGGTVVEALANVAITPGMLVEVMSTGKFRLHATAGGSAERMFALERDDVTAGGSAMTTDWAADSQVKAAVFAPGDEVIALLKNGETLVIGDKVESDGLGSLRKVDADASAADIGVQSIIGVSLEAIDLSGSSGADPESYLFKLRVM